MLNYFRVTFFVVEIIETIHAHIALAVFRLLWFEQSLCQENWEASSICLILRTIIKFWCCERKFQDSEFDL